jgi:hypothetical protein
MSMGWKLQVLPTPPPPREERRVAPPIDRSGEPPAERAQATGSTISGVAAAARVLVLIADAPPQRYPDFSYTYHHAMTDASRPGIRILPVAASGSDRVVEHLFRALGAFTTTPCVYLTDDSGIGNAHMEADTDRVVVERFSDLLTRLLISDLHGQGMHEPEWAERLSTLHVQ